MRPATLPSKDIKKLKKLKEYGHNLPLEELVLQIQRDPLKRAFDIFFSASFLLLFSPLFLILACLVRLTTPGPSFYKSRRLGRGGKPIECWKFRTMYQDAEVRLHSLLRSDPLFFSEWQTFQKVKLDPRITPIGSFLRKTSLDELPQFWNVLKGDLSVVGPRPPTLLGPPEEFLREIRSLYGDSVEKILSVRPGITGVWQISGRSQIPLDERRKLEERYAETRSFWQDLVLIAKTIPAVLFSRGAF
ncbi:MAG: sugar transferase [Chlamydiota bacterium]